MTPTQNPATPDQAATPGNGNKLNHFFQKTRSLLLGEFQKIETEKAKALEVLNLQQSIGTAFLAKTDGIKKLKSDQSALLEIIEGLASDDDRIADDAYKTIRDSFPHAPTDTIIFSAMMTRAVRELKPAFVRAMKRHLESQVSELERFTNDHQDDLKKIGLI